MEKQGHVYILELADKCWYVGWSAEVQVRIASHFLGAGSLWTQLHKPLQVVKVVPGDTMLESCITIQLMVQMGWQNVRGGSFVKVEMTKPPACLAKAMHYATFKQDAHATPEEVDKTTDEHL